jgi:hypothetical protein
LVTDASGLTLLSGSAAPTGTHKLLSATRGGASATRTDNTVGGIGVGSTIDPWGGAGSGDVWAGFIFITEPLNAVTLSSTPTVSLRGLESSTMANYGLAGNFYKVTTGNVIGDTGASSTFFGSNTTELGTTDSARALTVSLNAFPMAVSAGERLLFLAHWFSAGGTSSAGFTATASYNGPTSGAAGDSFITFTETITEQSLATKAPPFSPGSRRRGVVRTRI